jgi:MFS family permease
LERNSRLILISQFLVGITYGLFFFILPVHIRSLGATPSQVGLTLSAAGFSTLVVVLPFGYLADRYDLRVLMIVTKLFPIIPLALLAIVTRWQIVMLLLFLIYVEAAIVTVYNAYLTRILEGRELQRTFTVISFGYLIGEVIFRSVGAWIAQQAGMSKVFLLAAVVFTLSAIPLLFISEYPGSRVRDPVDYQPLLANRTFLFVSTYIFAVLIVMETGVALVPNYLAEVAGLELVRIGQAGSLTALGGALLSLAFGRIDGRGGLIAALLSMVVSMGVLILSPTGWFLPMGVFLMGSLYAYHSLADALIGRIVLPRLSGLAFGVVGMMLGVSMMLGPTFAGLLYERSPSTPLVAAMLGLALLVVLTVALPRPFGAQGHGVSE